MASACSHDTRPARLQPWRTRHAFNLGLYADQLVEACEARDDLYAVFIVARIIVETNMARTAIKLIQDGAKERHQGMGEGEPTPMVSLSQPSLAGAA